MEAAAITLLEILTGDSGTVVEVSRDGSSFVRPNTLVKGLADLRMDGEGKEVMEDNEDNKGLERRGVFVEEEGVGVAETVAAGVGAVGMSDFPDSNDGAVVAAADVVVVHSAPKSPRPVLLVSADDLDALLSRMCLGLGIRVGDSASWMGFGCVVVVKG